MGEWTDNNVAVVKDPTPDDRAALVRLREILRGYGSVAVAYSGGLDSTFLVYVAHQELGKNAVAITALSPVYPNDEIEFAKRFCKQHGVRHELVPGVLPSADCFKNNPPDRCYQCKKQVFGGAKAMVEKIGLAALADATNLDDFYDYRPGLTAAEELGVKRPLVDARLTKGQIRSLSRDLELAGWDRQSQACLASRFPFGTAVTNERLEQVEAAEEELKKLGFRVYRVRYHGDVARLELGRSEMERLFDANMRAKVYEKIKATGFKFVALDLKGYRSGSMNETIAEGERMARPKPKPKSGSSRDKVAIPPRSGRGTGR